MIGSIVSASALLGLSGAAAEATPRTVAEGGIPDELFAMSRLRGYKNRRSSSWDRSGGNNDWVRIEPGQSATLIDVAGAGVITHIWMTINSPDNMHLKNLVLRAWWDGESAPSVEVPVGDFFGLGFGEYFVYQSELLVVAPIKALNAYFQMPFSKAARITLSNEGAQPVNSYYFAVDYAALDSLPADLGRFHAQYRQAAPCKGWTNNWSWNGTPLVDSRKNLDGAGNYVYLEATGKGHFLGVTHAVEQNQEGWFGEGDDMFFVDGDKLPTINGTGTEDYFNGAWDYGGQSFANQRQGVPFTIDPERIGGRYCMYRWHTESPIAFEKSIRVTIEHGHDNHRSDNFYSVAYWYQTEPHAAFPVLPAPADRTPRIFAVGGAAGPSEVPSK